MCVSRGKKQGDSWSLGKGPLAKEYSRRGPAEALRQECADLWVSPLSGEHLAKMLYVVMHSGQKWKQKGEGQAVCICSGMEGGVCGGGGLSPQKQPWRGQNGSWILDLQASLHYSFPVLICGIMMGQVLCPTPLGCRV